MTTPNPKGTTPQKVATGSYPPPPSNPPPVTKPPDPQMGSCEETYPGSKKYYYVFGGNPNPGWTGLEASQTTSVSDLCYRTLDPVFDQESDITLSIAFSPPPFCTAKAVIPSRSL